MPRKKTPFAVDQDGRELYLDTRASAIHPLVVLFDGLTLIHFGRERRTYLRVADVVRWHEKELRESAGRSGNPEVLELLRNALDNFRAGKVVTQ